MNLYEILQGFLLGFLSGFFIFYTLQPSRPYPPIILSMADQPWMFIPLFALVWLFLYIDQRIALLLLLILIMIVVDIEFLGKKSY